MTFQYSVEVTNETLDDYVLALVEEILLDIVAETVLECDRDLKMTPYTLFHHRHLSGVVRQIDSLPLDRISTDGKSEKNTMSWMEMDTFPPTSVRVCLTFCVSVFVDHFFLE